MTGCRVLHVYSGNFFGGLEAFLVTLWKERHLTPNLHHEYALCFPGRLRDELVALGAPVHDLGVIRMSRPWTVFAGRRRLALLLAEGRFDAAATHWTWPHAIFGPTIRRKKAPLVFWAHGVLGNGQRLERMAARVRPDLAIANSQFTAGGIKTVFGDVPTHVRYLPVPDVAELRDPGIRRRVRREFECDDASAVIVISARIERYKGHELLIDALLRLKTAKPWKCWIVGGPQSEGQIAYQDHLRRKASEGGIEPHLIWSGERKDVPRILRGADIHCQPNIEPESFGIAFIEAMYAGLVVVTTAIGAPPEILADGSGITVPPANPQALADVLADLIDHPEMRQEYRSRAPARASELCDPQRALSLIEQSLREVSADCSK